jgi:hypothetical protein
MKSLQLSKSTRIPQFIYMDEPSVSPRRYPDLEDCQIYHGEVQRCLGRGRHYRVNTISDSKEDAFIGENGTVE